MLHELKISKYLYPPLPTCALISRYQGSTEKLKEALPGLEINFFVREPAGD